MAQPNWPHWAGNNLKFWTAEQAICLSLDIDPDSPADQLDRTDFRERLRELAGAIDEACVHLELRGGKVERFSFVFWASQLMEWDLPGDLLGLATDEPPSSVSPLCNAQRAAIEGRRRASGQAVPRSEIVLPPGTERVAIGEIPEMLASALNPHRADSQMVVSYFVRDEDGKGIPLTEDELRPLVELWRGLPSPTLAPTVDVPVDFSPEQVAAWMRQREDQALEAHRQRLRSAGITWSLGAVWLNENLNAAILRADAEQEHAAELRRAAADGRLRVKSQHTGLPARYPFPPDAIVEVVDLAAYAAAFGIRVRVGSDSVQGSADSQPTDAQREAGSARGAPVTRPLPQQHHQGSVMPGGTNVLHSMKRKRAQALDSEIAAAKLEALDPNDALAVFAVLQRHAEAGKGAFLGFVEGEGCKYQTPTEVKFFTVEALRKRMKRAAKGR